MITYLDEDAARAGEVEMIAVHPEHQRAGVGRSLLEHATGAIKAAGVELAVIATGGDPGHAPARALYERFGFRPLWQCATTEGSTGKNAGAAAANASMVVMERTAPRSDDSRAWLAALRGDGPAREDAIVRLHALLLRAAQHEVGRRRAALSHVRGEELEDIAMQAADDALMAVLGKLADYRGASRFTTWAYKFALLEAGVRLRRRAWQGREVVLEPDAWFAMADRGPTAHEELVQAGRLTALRDAIESALTEHQRRVFSALALNEVPIDVLSERMGTTRGALYKTLHDARKRLRAELEGEL